MKTFFQSYQTIYVLKIALFFIFGMGAQSVWAAATVAVTPGTIAGYFTLMKKETPPVIEPTSYFKVPVIVIGMPCENTLTPQTAVDNSHNALIICVNGIWKNKISVFVP